MKVYLKPESLDDESLRTELNAFASDGEYESYWYKSVSELDRWLQCLQEYVKRRRLSHNREVEQ